MLENEVDQHPNEEAFRKTFKYFKQKKVSPDWTRVIDFQDESHFDKNGIMQFQPRESLADLGSIFELEMKPLQDWKIYTLNSNPGLYFICNPFTKNGVEYWVEQAFANYCHPPNPTNIKENIEITNCNNDTILRKLRWATLGYHHNWDTKEYNENYKGEFPLDLSLLSNYVAKVVGFQDYIAEAAIVNYYALDSSIGGHTDHSEKNYQAPLISISFGQTAVFLLGGTEKSREPLPMFIKNGDIVVMSGLTRLSYHAVPRIILDPQFCIDGRWSSIMSKMRLNLNVRQVNI